MTMIKLNVHEAKTHLSKYLAKLKAGVRILLCKRNSPIAAITALPEPATRARPIGLAKGRFSIPPGFFEPLPEAFDGRLKQPITIRLDKATGAYFKGLADEIGMPPESHQFVSARLRVASEEA
jgi:antitoxin (DNA-binding transcriptional repressor) of toxin-antitoxin stability system